jgi:hypothetical protein
MALRSIPKLENASFRHGREGLQRGQIKGRELWRRRRHIIQAIIQTLIQIKIEAGLTWQKPIPIEPVGFQ